MSALAIRIATIEDASAVATMADALLTEIMVAIGQQAFDSDVEKMREQLRESIPGEAHFILLAERAGNAIGFAALSGAYSLYTNGSFGLITELFVNAEHRSQSVGECLLQECVAFAKRKGWSRLEVTTPPLPPFERTLAFYRSNGFEITGGRKLRIEV